MRLQRAGVPCVAMRDDLEDSVVLHVMHNNNSSVVAKHGTFPLSSLKDHFQHPIDHCIAAMRDRGVFDTEASETIEIARRGLLQEI